MAARRLQISPEQQEKSNKEWLKLTTEIQKSLHEDPAGPNTQALATRWQTLLDEFTGGEPEILKGFKSICGSIKPIGQWKFERRHRPQQKFGASSTKPSPLANKNAVITATK